MTERTINVRLTKDELLLALDALSYYRMSAEGGGPDDHPIGDIKRVESWLERYVERAERP